MRCWVGVLFLAGCAVPPTPLDRNGPEAVSSFVPTQPTLPPASTPEPESVGLLEIQFLGVGGYLLRHGSDAVMTPPMYTNPDFFETTLGTIASDPDLVDRFSEGIVFDDVSAILVGHAHYDHLLDAPTLWPKTREATLYGNASVAHILAAYAPEPPPGCEDRAPPSIEIPTENVVSLDDPDGVFGRDLVDYRMCGGDSAGEWVFVPDAAVRFRALCSMHPDQIGPIHFAPGAMGEDQCTPPEHADDWLEGQTLAYLIDFLDETGSPVYRIYYQDAPIEPPIGLFHPTLLTEKQVDVALLNVGSYTAVDDFPTSTLQLMAPRYTIGGHWEDFFFTQAFAPRPILGHDIEEYQARAEGALGDASEIAVLVDGEWSYQRSWVPDPGALFLFAADDP